jgi:hypothetical protein
VQKIAYRRVDIADDHEPECNLHLSREDVDSKEVEAHNRSTVCERLQDGSLPRGGWFSSQLLFLVDLRVFAHWDR